MAVTIGEPTTTIDQLPAAAVLGGTEPLPLVQGGNTKKTTASAIAQYAATSGLLTGLVVSCACATAGANITLTPVAIPAQAVVNQQQFSAIADATPTGPITATVNGIGPLPVYLGNSQAPEGSINEADFIVLAFDSSLGTGGGFHLQPQPLAGLSPIIFASVMQAGVARFPFRVGDVFQTLGYFTAGDGGGASYLVVASAPSHPGYITLANGLFGEFAGTTLDCRQIGLFGSDTTDNTLKFSDFIDVLIAKQIKGTTGPGRIIFTSPVTKFGSDLEIEFDSLTILDFSRIPAATVGFDNLAYGLAFGGGGAATSLPNLGDNVNLGDTTFTLASPPTGLAPGDYYEIYNTADYSWNNITGSTDRPYYRAGEFQRVLSISGAVITNTIRAWDNYLASADTIFLVKPDFYRVVLSGAPTIIGNAYSDFSGIVLAQVYNGAVNDFRGGEGCVFGTIWLQSCISTYVNRPTMWQDNPNIGHNYHIAMVACFDCHVMNPATRSSRHNVTITGGNITRSIPDRNCWVDGGTVESYRYALDQHGDCEYCGFRNVIIFGGVDLGGNHCFLQNCEVWPALPDGVDTEILNLGIRTREMKGCDVEISNVSMFAFAQADAGDGLLDLEFAPELGGTIRLNDVFVWSNVTQIFAANVVVSGAATQDVNLEVSNFTYSGPMPNPQFRVDFNGGDTVGGDHLTFDEVKQCAVDVSLSRHRIVKVSNSSVYNSVGDGLLVTLDDRSDLARQEIIVQNVMTENSESGGIVLVGKAGSTVTSYAEVRNCTSHSNNQSGTAGSSFKNSVAFLNLTTAILASTTIGDPQVTPTQNHTYLANTVGTLWSESNPVLGTTLAPSRTSVTTYYPLSPVISSVAYDAPSIPAGGSTTTTVTVPPAVIGQPADAWLGLSQAGLIVSAYVSAGSTVTVVLFNPTAGAIDLGSTTLSTRVWQ